MIIMMLIIMIIIMIIIVMTIINNNNGDGDLRTLSKFLDRMPRLKASQLCQNLIPIPEASVETCERREAASTRSKQQASKK